MCTSRRTAPSATMPKQRMHVAQPKTLPGTLWRSAASLLLVALICALCRGVLSVNSTTAGFAFLLGVLWIATTWGFVVAVPASVLAMLCFNYYFLPPVGQFTIADPQNWVALFAFLATALVASHLSDRAQRQTLDARARQRETEQLYALSRSILLGLPDGSLGQQVVLQILQIYDCASVALYNVATSELHVGGDGDPADFETQLKQVALQGGTLSEDDLLVSAVALGGQPIGSLALRGRALSDGALQALLNLVAIALERVRTEESSNRAEIARQSEEFKSTLLDAVAHEFKTPLTSIKAASTSLLSSEDQLPEPLRELAAIIDEEAARLSLLVTEAVRMSAIDAGKVQLEKWPLHVAELCQRVVAQLAIYLEGREVRIDIPADLPQILGDGDLIALALRQLLDNARKYSPPSRPLDLVASVHDGRVLLVVRDYGPGIAKKDLDRVFEKFYRRDSVKKKVPGSGLGLHIAREIVRAHGGELYARATEPAGTEFCLELPIYVMETES